MPIVRRECVKLLLQMIISSVLLLANTQALNKDAELPISFDEEGVVAEGSIVAITEIVDNSNVITCKYSDGSIIEIYPKSIEAFARNGVSINMNWSHRSAENEWWHKFVIDSQAYELFIREERVVIFWKDSFPEVHLKLIKEWIAMFPGFEDVQIEFYRDELTSD